MTESEVHSDIHESNAGTEIPQATNPFEEATSSYAKVRPGYPSDLIAQLAQLRTSAEPWAHSSSQGCSTSGERGNRAIDLGAGTGKMAMLLAESGWDVTAVEPAEAMRAQIPAHITRVDASAEDTGLPAGIADLIIAAQAWHWFDAEAATLHAAQLLIPGGHLVIVFNQLDVSIPWVHRLTRIMRSGDVHRPEKPPIADIPPEFTGPQLWHFHWTQRLSTDEVMELGRTRSSWLRQDQKGRDRMQENLRWYLHDFLLYPSGGEVTLPYSTYAWVYRREVVD